MKVYIAAVRRNLLTWLIPLLLALEVSSLFSRQELWRGDAAQLGATLTLGAAYGAFLLVSGTAYIAATAMQPASLETFVPMQRGLAPRHALAFASCLFAGIFTLICVGALGQFLLARQGVYGFPWQYYLLAIIGIVMQVALGYLIGRWLPHRVLAPLVGVIAGLLLLYFSRTARIDTLVLSAHPFTEVSPLAMFGRIALAAALTWCAIAVPTPREIAGEAGGQRKARLGIAGLVGALAAGSIMTLASGDIQRDRTATAKDYTCTTTGEGGKLCMWNQSAYFRPEAAAQADRVIRATRGILPVRAYQFDERGLNTQTQGFARLLGIWGSAEGIADVAMQQMLARPDRCADDGATNQKAGEISYGLSVIAFDAPQPSDVFGFDPGVDRTKLDPLAGAPLATQRAWLNKAYTAMKQAC